MANFIVIIDADTERRKRFIQQAKEKISPLEGLITGCCDAGNFSAVWASNRQAPVSFISDEKGASILLGEAYFNEGRKRIDAASLRSLWLVSTDQANAVLDGFFAGIVYNPLEGLVVGCDLLGIYPIYYYIKNHVVMVGSSPEIFKNHPVFTKEFNPKGLVGILTAMHILEGETLFKGVRRLQAGHILIYRNKEELSEVTYYGPPISRRYFSLPFSTHVDLLNEAINDSLKSQVDQEEPYTLLLSGGLDSRMLAGYLKQQRTRVESLTFGKKSDMEMNIARKIARYLKLRHRSEVIPDGEYPYYAELQSHWEHLVNGFNTIHAWGMPNLLRTPKVITGYVLDAVIGTRYLRWAFSPHNLTMSFDTFFEKINAYGIRYSVLQKLLRAEVFGNSLEEIRQKVRERYEQYSDMESQRVWCFNLYHRQRFHVGPILWRLSFGAWPVSPVFSRRVLETAGGMPAATIADRKAQEALLCQKFKGLATIPMDRNSLDSMPLLPGFRHYLSRSIYHRFRKLNKLGFLLSGNNPQEQRRYYRIYNLNSPGWVAVRKAAEPGRQSVMHLFNKDLFNQLLPLPEERFNCKDEIVDSSGPKLLLGFMLWAKDNLT